MIKPDPDMYFYSDFTDEQLQQVFNLLGPQVKDSLLLPGPVPIEGVRYDYRMAAGTEG